MARAHSFTPKQLLFIQEYLCDLNATQAAIRSGYSARNAGKIGPELLGQTRIALAIEAAMRRRAQSLEVSQQRVLQEAAIVAYSDHTHYVQDAEGNLALAPDAPRFATRAVAGVKRKTRTTTTKDGTTIIEQDLDYRLWDKNSAIDKLMRHLRMFPKEQADPPGDISINVVVFQAGATPLPLQTSQALPASDEAPIEVSTYGCG